MARRNLPTRLKSLLLGAIFFLGSGVFALPAFAYGREIPIPDIQFQPIRPTKAVTIGEAVSIALRNFPSITNRRFKLRAAQANIALAKTQYLPNLNADLQEAAISANRVASTVMNNVSGFDTVPVDSGPPSKSFSWKPYDNNLQGLNLNWLLVDFGLRRANDEFAFADARVAREDLKLTRLDVAYDCADSFLIAIAAKQVIRAKQAEFDRVRAANLLVSTLVSKGLKPGVDAASVQFDLSKAKIELIKAQKDTKLALVDLAERMGIADQDVDVVSAPLIHSPVSSKPFHPLDLSSHPLALLKTAEVARWGAKVNVLDKAYRPHLWFNSSIWGKGSGEPKDVNPLPAVAGGFLPQAFNYMVGVSFSFPFMEYFPLKAEKKAALSNEMAAKADLDLAMQILERKDARARVLLAESQLVAKETPKLVEAANVKEVKVMQRYRNGLANMVSVAEAERVLAEAQVEDALAQIEVWRSILALSYVQGDLKPFLKLVAIAESNVGNTSY